MHASLYLLCTVEPPFNEPPFNELLSITNNIFRPGKSYSKMYGTEPRFNEPRFNEPISAGPQAAQAYSLYFVWNFGSKLFIRLCITVKGLNPGESMLWFE